MRIVAILLAIILAVGILVTIGYVGFKTIDYMISQKFEFSDALHWGWDDYCDWLGKLVSKVKAEDKNFMGYDTRNRSGFGYSGPYTY